MTKQVQKPKTTKKESQEETPLEANKEVIEKGKETVQHTDDLLDKIDEDLEENAEELFLAYKQKGGE